ncbi:hypothetical protein [Bosea lathyri]|nr:hypothetical protein [Bosea lathyri]
MQALQFFNRSKHGWPTMKTGARTTAIAALSILPLLAVASPASASPERLQGAWVNSGISCDKAFVKRNGRLTLNKNVGDSLPGFLVSGKHVRGTGASCDLISSKQSGDVWTFLLGCDEGVIFDTMSVSLRFKDDNTLVRFSPDFPEVETTYNRCDR